MTAAVNEFSQLMRRAAAPAVPGELVSHAINRAARKLGLSRRTARAYWYGERATVPANLMDRARSIANEPIVKEAKNELSELDQRIARLEALLLQDEDFHRPFLDALRETAGRAYRSMAGRPD